MSIEYTRGQLRIDGRTAGNFDEVRGYILDSRNNRIGKVDREYILDERNNRIGKVERGYIYDARNNRIGGVIPGGIEIGSQRAKLLIKGAETLSDVAKVAIVHFLVKHFLTF